MKHRLELEPLRHLLPQRGEPAGAAHQHGVAGRQRVGQRRLPRAGAGGGIDHHRPAGLEDRRAGWPAAPSHAAEIGAAMVDGRVVDRAQHAVRHVGRAGDLQEMPAGVIGRLHLGFPGMFGLGRRLARLAPRGKVDWRRFHRHAPAAPRAVLARPEEQSGSRARYSSAHLIPRRHPSLRRSSGEGAAGVAAAKRVGGLARLVPTCVTCGDTGRSLKVGSHAAWPQAHGRDLAAERAPVAGACVAHSELVQREVEGSIDGRGPLPRRCASRPWSALRGPNPRAGRGVFSGPCVPILGYPVRGWPPKADR